VSHASPYSKAELRRSLLQARRSLSPEEWRTRSQQICTHLADSEWVQSAQTILAYFSIRQEPDLSALFALPKRWGFPRCESDRLVWHQWCPGEPLVRGALGVLEPSPAAMVLQPEAVDLMLVPAVACDRQGYRLGYGGGFYDRLLSQPAWQTRRTLGIVFEEAYLPTLPTDPWDCPLSGICTDTNLHILRA
jgi:5-formyltetrahydrofolate cyclo-ligase